MIKDWSLPTWIGCLDWEKKQQQKVLVTLKIFTDMSKACQSDKLVDCVEYVSLLKDLEKHLNLKTHRDLIETLAGDIAAFLIEYQLISAVEVTIKKLTALSSANYASVTISRES